MQEAERRWTILETQKDVAHRFGRYYCQRYAAEEEIGGCEVENFLKTEDIWKLTLEDPVSLEAAIEFSEVTGAIGFMEAGKAPENDGVTAGVYKGYADVPAPFFQKLLNSILEGADIPISFLHARVSVSTQTVAVGRTVLRINPYPY